MKKIDYSINNTHYADEGFDLKKYFFLIFKKRWIFISILSVVMVFDIIYTFKQTPMYRATSLIMIEKVSSGYLASRSAREEVVPRTEEPDYYNTQYEILKSRMLAKRVSKKLALKSNEDFAKYEFPENALAKMIRVEPLRNSRLLKLSVDYKDPVMATTLANTFATSYIEQNIESLLFMSKEILKAFPEDAKEVERYTIYGQLKDISQQDAIDTLPSVVNNSLLQSMKSERVSLDKDLVDLTKRYKDKHPKIVALRTKLKFMNDRIALETDKVVSSIKADLAGRLQANNIRVIDYAEVPRKPVSPNKPANIFFGLFLSICLGLGTILFMEKLDDSIKGQEDVERLGLPYLGDFPCLKNIDASQADLTSFADIEKSQDAYEAIRNIRTNIIFSVPVDKLKTILVTSTLPREGKSFIASYLAFSFAKNGFRTLIIDADLRKPRLHKLFGLGHKHGLVNMLVEGAALEDVITKTPWQNLFVLPAGSKTPNPLELLSSEAFVSIMEKASGMFDKIIIDTPPSYHMSDAYALSKLSGLVVLVAKYGMISAKIFDKLKQKFESMAGSKICGVIINFSEDAKRTYYRYKYYHKFYKNYYTGTESSGDNDFVFVEKNSKP